jgi:RNA polymerase sigma-70 factor (ECF subfamily)
MRAEWEGLHTALVRSISTLQADMEFQAWARAEQVLARFGSPAGLIEYLTGPGRDLDEKDRIYAAAVRATQAQGASSGVAQAVAWLGLWPGLDGVYRRRLKHFLGEENELVALISSVFTGLLGRMDLRQVRRVAATLVRSTERDVMEQRRRRSDEESRCEPRADPASALTEDQTSLQGGAFEGELMLLRERLLPIVGPDVDFLLAVLVLDETQREAGEMFGLSHEVARKRLQRAVTSIRANFAESLSQSAGETRVSPRKEAVGPEGAN